MAVFSKLKNKVLLFAVLVSCLPQLNAAVVSDTKDNNTFTLGKYIQSYVRNSPDLVKEYNNLNVTQTQFKNTFIDLFLPSADFGMGTTVFSKETPGIHFDSPYSSSFSVEWNIFNSGRDYLNYRKQKNNLEAAQIHFRNMLQDIVLDAIKTFYDLKLKESLLDVAQRDLEDKKDQFETTQYLYKDGLRAYTDLLQSENNFKNSQLRLAQETASYTSAKMVFNNNIGRDINEEIILDYELEAITPLYTTNYDEDLQVAIINREDINTAILRLHNQKIDNKLTIMNNLPMLNAGFGFSNTGNDIFGNNNSNRTDYSVGLSLNVPIGFFWVDKYNDVRVSKLELVNTYMDFEDILRNIRKAVSDSRTDLMLQFAGIEISENNLKIAKERLDITRSKYNDGNTSALDLSQAQDEYLSAQINDTTYKYNYQLNQYSYKRTLGLDVYDVSTLSFDLDAFTQSRMKQIDNGFLKNK